MENLLKNKIFILALTALSLVLVYFVGFNLSTDFGSAKVLEYQTNGVRPEVIEDLVKSKVTPEKVIKTEDGTLKLFFQNEKLEKLEEAKKSVSDEYPEITSKEYESFPAIDSNLSNRYLNILILGIIGAIVFTFIQFRAGLSIVQLFKLFFAGLLAVIFEFILAMGIFSLGGLAGLKLSYLNILALPAMLVISLLIKFIVAKDVQEKAKSGGAHLKENWNGFVNKNKTFLFGINILTLVLSIPIAMLFSGTLSFVILLNLFALASLYTTVYVIPELLDIQIKNADNRSKSRKSK